MSTCWFEDGKDAKLSGQDASDNPHVIGMTKLGAAKLSDEGKEWERGYYSVSRIASKAEVEAANRLTDLSQFRSRHRRQR